MTSIPLQSNSPLHDHLINQLFLIIILAQLTGLWVMQHKTKSAIP